jgi:hypothetical protein
MAASVEDGLMTDISPQQLRQIKFTIVDGPTFCPTCITVNQDIPIVCLSPKAKPGSIYMLPDDPQHRWVGQPIIMAKEQDPSPSRLSQSNIHGWIDATGLEILQVTNMGSLSDKPFYIVAAGRERVNDNYFPV